MPHNRFGFLLPAAPDVVFDAFHYRRWRRQWDTLVQDTNIFGGEPCPLVRAIGENERLGLMRALSMRTQFIAFDGAVAPGAANMKRTS